MTHQPTDLAALLGDSTDIYVAPDIADAAANGVHAQSNVTFGQSRNGNSSAALTHRLGDEPID